MGTKANFFFAKRLNDHKL